VRRTGGGCRGEGGKSSWLKRLTNPRTQERLSFFRENARDPWFTAEEVRFWGGKFFLRDSITLRKCDLSAILQRGAEDRDLWCEGGLRQRKRASGLRKLAPTAMRWRIRMVKIIERRGERLRGGEKGTVGGAPLFAMLAGGLRLKGRRWGLGKGPFCWGMI